MCYPLIINVVCVDNDRTFSSGVRLGPVLILGLSYNFSKNSYYCQISNKASNTWQAL